MTTQTIDQRTLALHEANRIRSVRAGLKRRWKKIDPRTARRELCEIVRDPSGDLLTWRVETALMALPWVGRAKVTRWMLECRIPLSKTIGGLSDRQRDELVAKVLG